MGLSKTCPSALMRKIIETDLIEEHHWLPQDIAKIPYKNLQYYHLIRRMRRDATNQRPQIEAMKAAAKTSEGHGQMKRFTKVTKLTP